MTLTVLNLHQKTDPKVQQDFKGQGHYDKVKGQTRRMFLLTKTKRPKKVHRNIIYSRKRFLKIKTCSAERRSES